MNRNSNWSYSKFQLYQSCPLAVKYESEFTDGHSELVSINSLIGILFHETISSHILKWSKEEQSKEDDLIETFISNLHIIWQKKNSRIIEISNGFQVKDSELKRIESSTIYLIKHFFDYIWPRFYSHMYLTHEHTYHFQVSRYQVVIRPDLVTKDPQGRIVVTDWKTGAYREPEFNSFQTAIYGLWAHTFFSLDPVDIITQTVNVKTGEIKIESYSEKKLVETSNEILRSIEEINNALEGDLVKPRPERSKCKSCKFLKLCEHGKEAVTDA